mgnify:FL=1
MEIFSVRADCFFIPFFNDIMSIVQEKMYMDVDDVCAILGVSKTYAYSLMREYNKELKAKGYIVVAGKISTKFLAEKIYGMKVED